jgi:enamine deaminase RidA (YjgF/YER057c/UK114 family)
MLSHPAQLRAGSDVSYIDPDARTGISRAVVVRNTPLAHTSWLLPVGEQGKPDGMGNSAAQIGQVLERLGSALAAVHSGFHHLIKVNVYAADAGVIRQVQKVFANRFTGRAKPAATFVVGDLPNRVAVAMDAVALAPRIRSTARVARFHVPSLGGAPNAGQVAVLPPGGAFYVSGQAGEERREVRSATLQTMESLQATLNHLGLGWPQVVQLRAFVNQPSELAAAEASMLSFLGVGTAPPIVVAPCASPSAVEIELIAASLPIPPARKAAPTLRHMTLPGMKASPLYSKVVLHGGAATIYTSGLHSRAETEPAGQIRDIFSQLGELLKRSGSDFDHLVKATYYASDPATSRLLNDIRPEFLSPQRPPAASKRLVKGVGMDHRNVTLDMIATSP